MLLGGVKTVKRIMFLVWIIFLYFGSIQVLAEEQSAKENYDYSNQEFLGTVSMLNMEGHSNDDLSNCSVKQMYYEEVAEMYFTKGMSKREILDYYEKAQGVQALNAPPVKGFNLSLWITPFFLILLVFIILFFLIRKWRGNLAVSNYEEDTSTSEIEDIIYASVIEEERKKFL
jgi:cytochrome c-type biogenesis protein CcmH